MNYQQKYLKYKNKYLNFKKNYLNFNNKIGAGNPLLEKIEILPDSVTFMNLLSGLKVVSQEEYATYLLLHAGTYNVIHTSDDDKPKYNLHHDEHGAIAEIHDNHYEELKQLFGNQNNIKLNVQLHKEGEKYYITVDEIL